MRAFDIGTDLNLHFPKEGLEQHYDTIQQWLSEELQQTAEGRRMLEHFHYVRKRDVKKLFRQLFGFYLQLQTIKSYNNG